jgi:monoamine oxidase
MARTPLLHQLQRLAHDFAEAESRHIAVEDVQEQRRWLSKGIRRRDLLKGAGIIAGGIALAPLPGWGERILNASASSIPRIGIIGAGIAGMNAALTLYDSGLPATIYEAAGRIGGRMHSNTTTWANQQVTEWCGELIDTGHTTIQGLAMRFGLPLVDVHKAEPPGSQTTYYFFGKYYTQAQANTDFKPVFAVLKQQLKAAPITQYNHYNAIGYQLDHISIYDWIEQYVPGGHTSTMGQLLDVAYNSEFGRETTVQSSLNLLYLLAFQPHPGVLNIYGISDERYHIEGGNQQLPLAIAASLPAGSVKLNWKLQVIKKNSDATITLTFSTPDGKQQRTFDHVILTLPFSVLRNLDYSQAGFTNLKQTDIVQIGYGTNSKLQLQFDTRFWNGMGPWPGVSTGAIFTDVGFQTTWEATRGQAGKTGIIVEYPGGNYGASYNPDGPYTTSDNEKIRQYARQFLRKLEEIWPGISTHYTGTATLSYPTGDPNLLGSYSCWLVGQYTTFAGYEKIRQGNIHFAGEHCSYNFQGYMEGGAREGKRAADEILSDYHV